jgi:serine protease
VGGDAERAWYSNYGTYVDLAAPGGDPQYDANGDRVPDAIVSTHATGYYADRVPDYGTLFGTSMAAPHVAGVFSLMKGVAPSLTPVDFERLLAAGALTDDPLQHVQDSVGYGVLDALKAVRAATGSFDGSPRLVASPSVMRFDGNVSLLGLKLSNAGGGVLTVTAINPSAPWLSTSPASADANGLGTHAVIVDRTGLPFGGERRGSLQVVTTAGTTTVPVLVSDSFGWSVARGDYPIIYIRIVDADTGALVHFTRLPTDPWGIRFDDVPPGRYFVTAGTDLNHDGDMCDAGELCGENPFYGLHQALDYVDTSEDVDVPLVLTAKQDPGL